MTNQNHWDTVYETKAPDAVNWYRPHLERSLELIQAVVPDVSASIIDVGGGESTLVDDLLAKGYRDISVLDISRTAIEVQGRIARRITACAASSSRRLSAYVYRVSAPGQSLAFSIYYAALSGSP